MPHQPSLKQGLKYWENQEASIDGVLGGYGTGSLPRVDALGSRQFLLSVLPKLCRVPSPLKALNSSDDDYKARALDVGAGVGRVTSDVLLHLVSHVILVEPVQPLISEALASSKNWKGIASKEKSVLLLQQPMQQFDPSEPLEEEIIYGHCGAAADTKPGYDVIWAQWCLGHLSDTQLIRFLKQSQASLRPGGVIVVKENCCGDARDGESEYVFDEDDSSITRSDKGWLSIFKQAGLTLVKDEIQHGLPAELYVVKSYALR